MILNSKLEEVKNIGFEKDELGKNTSFRNEDSRLTYFLNFTLDTLYGFRQVAEYQKNKTN